MKGCSLACLLHLLAWAVLGGAAYVYQRQFGIANPEIVFASIGAGLFATLSGASLLSIFTTWGERKTLLGAMVGKPLVDGEWVAVSGPIRAMRALQTPFTNEHAVAYEYEIYRMERNGKSTTKVNYWQGKALTPSSIASRQGTVRLLSVPTLDMPWNTPASRTGFENAARYISETTFQTRDMPKDQRIGMEQEHADDDGAFRLDKQEHANREVELSSCSLQEKFIRQGETVCAFGLYSSSRGGIIPHPNWSKQTRVMIGDANAVAAQLRKRIIRYAVGVVCFAAIAFGIVKVYEKFVPKPQSTSKAAVTLASSVASSPFSPH